MFCPYAPVSSDSQLLASGGADKNIRIWGLDFGDCHRSIFAHDGRASLLAHTVRVHSACDDASQVRTLISPDVPGSARFSHFWAVLFNFGRFQREYATKNTPIFQVPGLIRNIMWRVHSYPFTLTASSFWPCHSFPYPHAHAG
jgi:hypothetical protein